MQLMRTNAVFSRIALVSRFCAENQLSRKILENMPKILFYPKTHGARRVGAGEPRRAHPPPPQARARPGHAWGRCGRLRAPLDLSFGLYIAYTLKQTGGRRFPEKSSASPPERETPSQPPETPFWHPVRTGNWRRSSPSSSPTPLHQPSMIPPSMCEFSPAIGWRGW